MSWGGVPPAKCHPSGRRAHDALLLSTTGLRIGEALALSWECVDLNAKRLLVMRSLQRQRGNGLVFAEPKTLRSRRLVHLSSVACAALRDHRCWQLSRRPSM